MSISVECPHCSATVQAKDSDAGRTVKCPTCQGAVAVGGTAKPSARPRDDDEEDDRPRRKRRYRDDDDEEDDRPRRHSRRDDPPKKSALPLVLGIVGGLLLLCGGGCAGVYFFGIKPAAERVKAINDQRQLELDEAFRRDQEALNRPPVKPNPPVPDPPKPRPDVPRPDRAAKEDNAIEVTAADLVGEYAKDLKAADAKYRGKTLKVTGEVKQVTATQLVFVGKADGGYDYQVQVQPAADQRAGLSDLKAGDKVTITGRAFTLTTRTATKTKSLILADARLVK